MNFKAEGAKGYRDEPKKGTLITSAPLMFSRAGSRPSWRALNRRFNVTIRTRWPAATWAVANSWTTVSIPPTAGWNWRTTWTMNMVRNYENVRRAPKDYKGSQPAE